MQLYYQFLASTFFITSIIVSRLPIAKSIGIENSVIIPSASWT